MKSFTQKMLLVIVFLFAFAPLANADTMLPPGIIEQQQCGNTVVDVRAFGAGLMYQPAPIVPQNDRIIDVRASEGCAVLEWTTPIVATAQVIIAEVGAQPQSVDATHPPFFWYPAGTTQNADAVGVHRVVIKDLVPGKTYSYRLVSRSHPTAIPYISEEKFLTVPALNAPFVTAPSAPTIVPINTPTTTPTVSVVSTSAQPKVTYTTKTVTTTEVVSVPATSETEATITETPHVVGVVDAIEESVIHSTDPISAITAVTSATETALKKNTFWERFARAFSFSFAHKKSTSAEPTEALAQETDTEMLVVNDTRTVKKQSAQKDLVMTDRYIVPSLFFLVLLYLLQQLLLPALGMKVEQPLVFWMFGVIAIAVFAGLFKFFYVTVFMIAVFLALLAWYILDLFDEAEIKPSVQ